MGEVDRICRAEAPTCNRILISEVAMMNLRCLLGFHDEVVHEWQQPMINVRGESCHTLYSRRECRRCGHKTKVEAVSVMTQEMCDAQAYLGIPMDIRSTTTDIILAIIRKIREIEKSCRLEKGDKNDG
jgi:hypothetical protein